MQRCSSHWKIESSSSMASSWTENRSLRKPSKALRMCASASERSLSLERLIWIVSMDLSWSLKVSMACSNRSVHCGKALVACEMTSFTKPGELYGVGSTNKRLEVVPVLRTTQRNLDLLLIVPQLTQCCWLTARACQKTAPLCLWRRRHHGSERPSGGGEETRRIGGTLEARWGNTKTDLVVSILTTTTTTTEAASTRTRKVHQMYKTKGSNWYIPVCKCRTHSLTLLCTIINTASTPSFKYIPFFFERTCTGALEVMDIQRRSRRRSYRFFQRRQVKRTRLGLAGT